MVQGKKQLICIIMMVVQIVVCLLNRKVNVWQTIEVFTLVNVQKRIRKYDEAIHLQIRRA